MTIRPKAGHVFIEFIPTVADGLIAIPETVKKDYCNGGKIVAVASYRLTRGGEKRPMLLARNVGEYAVFKPRTADLFSVKGRTFYNVHEDHVLAIIPTLEEFQKVIVSSS